MDQEKSGYDTSVTLVDLIALVLRNRKVIVSLTALTTLIGVVLLFGLPAMGKSIWSPAHEYKATMNIYITRIPLEIRRDVPVNILETTKQLFEDPALVQSALTTDKKSGEESSEKSTISELIRNQLKLTVKEEPRNAQVTVTLYHENKEKAKEALLSISDNVRAAVDARLKNSLELNRTELAERTEEIESQLSRALLKHIDEVVNASKLEEGEVSFSRIVSEKSDLLLSYLENVTNDIRIENVLRSNEVPWPEENEVIVERTQPKSVFARNPLVGLLIFIVAGLILGMAGAFMLDYIRYIRSNPSEMEKLRSAGKKA